MWIRGTQSDRIQVFFLAVPLAHLDICILAPTTLVFRASLGRFQRQDSGASNSNWQCDSLGSGWVVIHNGVPPSRFVQGIYEQVSTTLQKNVLAVVASDPRDCLGARRISNSGRHASFGKPPGFFGRSKFNVLGTKETPPPFFFFMKKR